MDDLGKISRQRRAAIRRAEKAMRNLYATLGVKDAELAMPFVQTLAKLEASEGVTR